MCLTTTLRTAFAIMLSLMSASAFGADSRPNFLFLLTDDQRWDALGVVQKEQQDKARFPWLKTPNLDRLAAEGIRFRNAFVVNSLCSPSRACFLTGTYGNVHGIVNNSTPFPADMPTYATLLRAAGYTTGFVGKWHMDRQIGPRPGFDFSASFLGQGRYHDCPFNVNGKETETSGWVDDVSTDYAIQFLRRQTGKPFVLAVGFKTAHGPFGPPTSHAGDYKGERSRPVPNLELDPPYPKKPGAEDRVAADFIAPDSPQLLGYMRCITAMDADVGKILAELDRLKLAENTMVVFAGDNGYYLREHGLGDKRTAYEESIRIPLLVRWPKARVAGRVMDEMVLNIDLAPTFLDLAGVTVPERMQGRSWKPLLAGTPADWRKSFYYDYPYEAPFKSPATQAIRTQRAKLIRYPGHPEWSELFDLGSDPYETKNLFADPAQAPLRQEMESLFQSEQSVIMKATPASRAATTEPTAPRERRRNRRARPTASE